jgi:FHA domain
MSRIAIEFNDADVLVADESALLAGEPGYAIKEGAEIRTGAAAYRESRVKPKQVSNDYWAGLSLAPASSSVTGTENTAELAFAQLRGLWEQIGDPTREAVFVVPGSFARDQLGILLGLAEECRIPVKAMIDAAVAASHCHYPGRDLFFLDAGLHEVAVTLVGQGEEAVLGARQALEALGIVHLTDQIARSIAQAFVLKTRFDPLHDAKTEQQLYDALPGWLARLHEHEGIDVTMAHQGDEFKVTIERQHIRSVASGFYRAVLQLVSQSRESRRPIVVQVSHRLTRWPGLVQELLRLDEAEIVELDRGHAARSVLGRLAGALNDATAGVRLLRHLPFSTSAPARHPREPSRQDPPSAIRLPTHIVYAGTAYGLDRGDILVGRTPIGGRRMIVIDAGQSGVSATHCEIGLRDGELHLRDTSRYGTYVNEKRVSGEAVLKPADVVRIGTPGAELHVVALEADHGA